MPTKKTQDEIFYVEKKVSNTPHPIIVGCGDIFFHSSIIGKQKSIKNSKFNIKIQTPLNNNINGFNINKISDLIYSSKYDNVDQLIELLLNNDICSNNIEIILDFDYFLEKKAPVSNKKSSLLIESSIKVQKNDENISYYLICKIPYIASCPVSKEISDYGAHNQKGSAKIEVELCNFNNERHFWIEDLTSIVEDSCSCPVYNSIELQDKAFQTEMLYEKPLFIEEITQNIQKLLKKHIDKSIKDYSLSLIHHEGINSFVFLSKTNLGKTLL